MVALKAVLMFPVLCAGIRVNEEGLKLNEDWFGFGGKKENATEAAPEPSADDSCHQALEGSQTRKSAWRRTHKCKCAAGQNFQCPDRDCEETGRYFKASQVKEGCTCGSCTTECGELVTNAVPRNSAWRRTSSKCKCVKGFEIRGKTEACAKGGRYFTRKEMRNQGCSCEAVAEEAAAPGEAQPEPVAPPAQQPSPGTDEQGDASPDEEKKSFEDQFKSKTPAAKKAAATRGAGGLALSALLLAGVAFVA